MKRILFVISTLNYGGAQRALANMSLKLAEWYEIDFLLNDSDNISYEYKGNIIDLGIKGVENRSSVFYQFKVFVKRFVKLYELKKTGRYVACISALTSANAVNVLTGNKYCKTLVSVRIHMSKRIQCIGKLQGWIEKAATKGLFNRADGIVAVSKIIAVDLMERFHLSKEKIVSIYNGYELQNMKMRAGEPLDNKGEEWFKGNGYTIVSVGRLSKEKGHIHLIKAFAYVRKYIQNARLLILGEGELAGELEENIKRLGLEDVVKLYGFANNPYQIVIKSYLFVMSSLNEGFPNALAESLCLGVPSISTDCDSGAREILAPNTDLTKKVLHGFEKAEYGILCPVCESENDNGALELTPQEMDMADAMLYMLQNQDVYAYYKEKARERAEQLSMDKIIEQWIALIEE